MCRYAFEKSLIKETSPVFQSTKQTFFNLTDNTNDNYENDFQLCVPGVGNICFLVISIHKFSTLREITFSTKHKLSSL